MQVLDSQALFYLIVVKEKRELRRFTNRKCLFTFLGKPAEYVSATWDHLLSMIPFMPLRGANFGINGSE
jgi:hypothetical protein